MLRMAGIAFTFWLKIEPLSAASVAASADLAASVASWKTAIYDH